MKKLQLNSLFGWMALPMTACLVFLLVVGWATPAHSCAGGKKPKFSWEKGKERQQSCVVVLNVCRTAEIISMNCLMNESGTKDAPKFQFQISVKNISDRARRYNLGLFLSGGPSDERAGLSKGMSATLKPGEEKAVSLPIDVDKSPETVTLKVENPWSFKDAPRLFFERCSRFAIKAWNIFRDSSSQSAPLETVSTMRIYCQPIK